MTNYAELASKLKPYILPWLGGGNGAAATGGMIPHTLSGAYHTGTLAQTQAPWAATVTALNSHIASASHVNASTAGAGLTYTTGVLAVGAGAGVTVNADDVALTTPGTLTYNTTNVASGNHTHAITTSSAPGAAAAILASTAGGGLTLVNVAATAAVTTPSIAAATTLTIDAGGNVINIGASNTLKTANYASQTTGWGITYAGAADFRYLFTDELHAKSFIADLEQALAGGQIICKSVAMLGEAFTVPAASGTATLTVRDLPSAPNMAVFEANDIVRLRTFSRAAGTLTISDCWGVVTAYADQTDGTQTWTFTRSAAPNAGAITASTVIAVDSIVLDYGTDGNGIHEINAIDGAYGLNSPYSQVKTWATHPATGETVRTRIGNLRGLFSVANEYGLYAGNGVTDASSFIRLSSNTNRLNNLPMEWWNGGTKFLSANATDGLTIYAPATYDQVRSYGFKTSGGLFFGGMWSFGSRVQVESNSGANAAPSLVLNSQGTVTYPGTLTIQANGASTAKISLNNGDSGDIQITASTLFASGLVSATGLKITGAGIALPDGTASAPSLQWELGGNTGVYLDTTNTLAITTNGSKRFEIGNTGALFYGTLYSAGNLTTSGTLTLDPDTTAGDTTITNSALQMGTGRSADGTVFIDLVGDTTYTDYGLRIIRNTTSSGTSQLIHRGTGNFELRATEAAALIAYTSATKRFSILSDGLTGIGNITPTSKLHVDGNARAKGFYADAENGGIASTVGLSNGSQGVSTGNGTVKVNGTTARDSTGWIKIYVGTDIRWIPYWTTVTG